MTEFSLPVPGRQPSRITSGPDGNLWFTEAGSPGGIGRITTAGVVTEFLGGGTPGFTADRVPTGITTGADGNLWFTETGDPGAIVRVSLLLSTTRRRPPPRRPRPDRRPRHPPGDAGPAPRRATPARDRA